MVRRGFILEFEIPPCLWLEGELSVIVGKLLLLLSSVLVLILILLLVEGFLMLHHVISFPFNYQKIQEAWRRRIYPENCWKFKNWRWKTKLEVLKFWERVLMVGFAGMSWNLERERRRGRREKGHGKAYIAKREREGERVAWTSSRWKWEW